MKSVDKTEQRLKEQYDALGEVLTATNKRDVREARKRLKQQIHKHERNVGKRQLRDLLTNSDDCE